MASSTSKESITVAPPTNLSEVVPVAPPPPVTPPPLTLAWMQTLGESRGVGDVVAVRQDGSILVGGSGEPSERGKRGRRAPSKKLAERTSAYVASLTADGALGWRTELSGGASIRSVAALPDGGAVVCGDVSIALRVNGRLVARPSGPADRPADQRTKRSEASDLFVLALAPGGALRWSATAGGAEYDA